MNPLDWIYRLLRRVWRRKHGPARKAALAALREAFVSPESPVRCIEMDREHGSPLFCVLVDTFDPQDEIRRAGGLCLLLRDKAQEIVHGDERFGTNRDRFDSWDGVWFTASADEFEERGRSSGNWWTW